MDAKINRFLGDFAGAFRDRRWLNNDLKKLRKAKKPRDPISPEGLTAEQGGDRPWVGLWDAGRNCESGH